MITYVILTDITPNRGTIARAGRDVEAEVEGERRYEWHGDAAPVIGDRAWHRAVAFHAVAVSSAEPCE